MTYLSRISTKPIFPLKTLPATLLLASYIACSPAHASEDPASKEPEAASDATLDNTRLKAVTVTARRREESAQDVPATMSVISGQSLENQRVYRIQDLQQLTPSLNVAYMHARQSSVSIRGLGNNPGSDGLEGSAGLYIDNVYLGRPGMAVFDLMDIEQLEVLRGPQGTLFGKNTTAGVVNISTRLPSFTPERSIETSFGEDGFFQTKGTISGPISEVMAGRFSAYRSRSDGDLKNEYNGHDLNGGSREGFKGQLLYKPSEDFSLRIISDYNEESSSAGTHPLYSTGPTINGVNRFESRAAAVGATLVDGRKRRVNIDGVQRVTVHQGGLSAEANWKLSSDFTLTSVSAYRWWDFSPRNDDTLNVPVTNNSGVSVQDKQWSQEFRLASPIGGTFDYVLGAYYFGSDLDNETKISNGPLADLWNGTPTGALSNVQSLGKGHIETNSFALFSQGTWHLTPKLDFTAGLRGTYEEKDAWVNRSPSIGGEPVSGAALVSRNARFGAYESGSLNQYSFSPSGLLSLSYIFNEDLLGYVTLSHGEKSGGVNLSVGTAPTAGAESLEIGSERANNLELGIKSTLLDNRLQLNGNLFWTRVNGYQTTGYDEANRVQYLTNAGSVRSRGAELEATLIPLRGLTINVNGSYNDVRYLSYKDAPCPPEVAYQPGAPASCDLSGNQVVGASKWIANINSVYEWHWGDNLVPYVTGSYAYRSKAVGTVEDSSYAQIPAYGVANFSTGLRGNWGQGQWDLSLWVKNAFDKTYYTTFFNEINGGYSGFLGTPRTLGATARYDF
ncbi:TonB-dependent receptor [Pseudomonas sp. S60]|uniref:TonB-dependent receptor n=1 Tax=Pseudomonas sp. S60 TaxID=211124 RepID=UPI001913EBEA|nr:TonB-dependent receptor [Pseudomonas sp. S60]MBK5012807.1 TonB-dependent receptor [Pseudomonas sp. S60]